MNRRGNLYGHKDLIVTRFHCTIQFSNTVSYMYVYYMVSLISYDPCALHMLSVF